MAHTLSRAWHLGEPRLGTVHISFSAVNENVLTTVGNAFLVRWNPVSKGVESDARAARSDGILLGYASALSGHFR